MINKFIVAAAALSVGLVGTANATINVIFADQTGGANAFDATVTAAGETVTVFSLPSFSSGLNVDFGAFSITRNDGTSLSPDGVYTSGSESFTGNSIDIDPDGTFPNSNGTVAGGITLTFDSAVNALGFEVGDWGTCCYPSKLFISFDGGAPITVGTSLANGDVFLTGGEPIVFVSALDDSADFTTVQFWGDGSGEVLNFGGTLRYALLDRGTLPPQGAVPEPATWAMMMAGFGLVGGTMRYRRRKSAVSFA